MFRRTYRSFLLIGLCTVLGAACDNDPVSIVEADSLIVVPTDAQIIAGGAIALAAQALDGTGRVLPEARIVWSSSNSVVATVFPDSALPGVALVQAVSVGTAMITATHGGINATASVTVVPDSLGFLVSFNIEQSSITMPPFSSQELTITAFNRRGVPTFPDVAFNSPDPGIAQGQCCWRIVSGSTLGTVRVTATVPGGLSDFVDVTVQ